MRISYWSSDVCSSDLLVGVEGAQIVDRLADADRVDGKAVAFGRGDQHAAARGAVELGHHQPGDPRDPAEHVALRQRILAGDRKRGVSGKRVSVRVDLGGSRIILMNIQLFQINK